tara:strand:+ start:65 stop:220 length:156 start_codon:yes stop_codon:yes gene_type:complete
MSDPRQNGADFFLAKIDAGSQVHVTINVILALKLNELLSFICGNVDGDKVL